MMSYKTILFYIVFFTTCLVSAQNSIDIKLLNDTTTYVVGDSIVLKFKTTNTKSLQLYCANSYGNTLVQSTINNDVHSFAIPRFLAIKKGVLNWSAFTNKQRITGNISILPKENPVMMETYLGPPSIEAGGTDYTMLVVIPTDDLDNPLVDGTEIDINKQFLTSQEKIDIKSNNLIGYRRIFSPIKSGRVILSSKAKQLDSKEFDVNIMPAIAENFQIFYDRIHEYADGNQITTFYTSIIKDKNENVVSDGTFVDFFVKNLAGNVLKTSGTTIKGIAYAKMLHPDAQETWNVKAIITGISESDTISLSYKRAITDYSVTFSEGNRKIKIGPIKSFMNQMIPDGLTITLKVFYKGKEIEEMIKPSRDGYAFFELDKAIYKDDVYTFKINTAGIEKNYESKKIW
ncbi:hypothetical protein [Polaribacter dokdonensis]|uniref:Uncharacterized protein n=1 Tax=Polaribacter dokdonensis DSW-5 TaxID=1300348 RepID=A0A0M9CHQ0_9FLAO|nr:hypothetical protein [Polaribacter dokdonensis]KOY52851.1 hypothetical protein I602_2411 [Polaribacter dokdonensis DSW-5]SEE53400.1 hypothetical protein SAMN05444353_2186 [Polaribacter dokdonensis DSW-5]